MADLWMADLWMADLWMADLWMADLWMADLWMADVCGCATDICMDGTDSIGAIDASTPQVL